MPKNIHITIPVPCHENWEAMAPADKGRFCASCQKNVIDFTQKSDREIINVLKHSGGETCGRFNASQLNRDVEIHKEKGSLWMAASAAIVSFLTLGNYHISAQTTVNIHKIQSKPDALKNEPDVKTVVIKGNVCDESGLAIPGVTVVNSTTNKNVMTDFDGNFSLPVNRGDNITFTYIGMETRTVTYNGQGDLKTIMKEDPAELVEVIAGRVTSVRQSAVVGGGTIISVCPEKRTFFGRLFQSVGNIFH